MAGSFVCVAFRHDCSPWDSGSLKEVRLRCHCVLCRGHGLKECCHKGQQNTAALAVEFWQPLQTKRRSVKHGTEETNTIL